MDIFNRGTWLEDERLQHEVQYTVPPWPGNILTIHAAPDWEQSIGIMLSRQRWLWECRPGRKAVCFALIQRRGRRLQRVTVIVRFCRDHVDVPEHALSVNSTMDVIAFHESPDRQSWQRSTELIVDRWHLGHELDFALFKKRHDGHNSSIRLSTRYRVDTLVRVFLCESSVHLLLDLDSGHEVTELEGTSVLLRKPCRESVISAG